MKNKARQRKAYLQLAVIGAVAGAVFGLLLVGFLYLVGIAFNRTPDGYIFWIVLLFAFVGVWIGCYKATTYIKGQLALKETTTTTTTTA